MGFELKIEKSTGSIPIFQRDHENAQGGFTLDIAGLIYGAKVPEGTLMGFDESTRKAKVLKVAEVFENALATATEVKIKKGHLFIVGDFIGKNEGAGAFAINAIDKTSTDYDTLTLATTLGVALSSGDALFQSSASGESACTYAVKAQGLLYQEVKAEVNTPCSVTIRATVYERRIPVVPLEVKALLPNIIFSQSY